MATVNNLSQITGNTVTQDVADSSTSPGWSVVNGDINNPNAGFTAAANEFDFFLSRTGTIQPTFTVGQEIELQFRITGTVENFNRGIYFQPYATTRVVIQQVNPIVGSSRIIRVRTTNLDDLGNDFAPTDNSDPSLNSRNISITPTSNRDTFGIEIRTGIYSQITNNASNVFTNSNIQFTSTGLPGSGSILSLDANGRLTRASIAGLTFQTETDLVTNELPVEFNVSPDGLTVEALVDTTGIATTISDLDTSLNAEIDALAFTSLTDTPSSLGSAGQEIRVNSAGNGLEFFTQSHTDDNYFFRGSGVSGNLGSIASGTTATISPDSSSARIPSSWRIGSLGNVRVGTDYQNFTVTAINLFGAERTSMDVTFGTGQGFNNTFSAFDVAQGNLDTDTRVTIQENNTGSSSGYDNLEVNVSIDPVAGSANAFDVSAFADISELRGERFFGVASGGGINPNSLQDSTGYNTTLQVSSGIRGYDWRANQWGFGITELASAVPYVFTFRVISVSGTATAPTLNIRVTKFNSVGTVGNAPQSFYIFQGQPNPTRFLNNPSTTENTVPVIFTENHDEGTVSATANVESVISMITASTSSAAISVFEEDDEITQLVNTMRFSGAGVTATQGGTVGDITITVPEVGDHFFHELTGNINLSQASNIHNLAGLGEGHDWVIGMTGFAQSTDGRDEFTFVVDNIIGANSDNLVVNITSRTRSSNAAKANWRVFSGPPAERFADLTGVDTDDDLRPVSFERNEGGELTGTVNVFGLGGGGSGGGATWVYDNGSTDFDLFRTNEWAVGQSNTLELSGFVNNGWEVGHVGHLVGSSSSSRSIRNMVVNFRVTGVVDTADPVSLTVSVTDSIVHTNTGNFFWGIYPGIADIPLNVSSYTDLDVRLWNNATRELNGIDENPVGITGNDPDTATEDGDLIHVSNLDDSLAWVGGQSGYVVHYTGRAAFTFTVPGTVGADAITSGDMQLRVDEVLYNTLGNQDNNFTPYRRNRWSIFAGAPTPDIVIDPPPPPLEIHGDVDNDEDNMGNPVSGIGVATSAATRLIFSEDDFELHIGSEAVVPATTSYLNIQQGSVNVVTNIFQSGTNSAAGGSAFNGINIQIGLEQAGLAPGSATAVTSTSRLTTTPAMNNPSGLVLAYESAPGVFTEVLQVRSDTDSNGNTARVRCDLINGTTLASYRALGTNVPLFYRAGPSSGTDDDNQVIVRAKAQPGLHTVDFQPPSAFLSTWELPRSLFDEANGTLLPAPIVQVYESGTNTLSQVIPDSIIISTDPNSVNRITINFSTNVTGTATVLG